VQHLVSAAAGENVLPAARGAATLPGTGLSRLTEQLTSPLGGGCMSGLSTPVVCGGALPTLRWWETSSGRGLPA